MIALVVSWPINIIFQNYGWEDAYDRLAASLSWVHLSWIVLLLVDVVSILSDRRTKSKRRIVGTLLAIMTMWYAFLGSEQMKRATTPLDLRMRPVVFTFEFDPETQKFWLDTSD